MSISEVEFIHGDALDPDVCDWTDGDIVFANSTCFDDPFMRRLASAATALKKGSIFITLTKRLPVRNVIFGLDPGSGRKRRTRIVCAG